MTRYTNALDHGFHRVVHYLSAILVYGLNLLIATPFFLVLFAPFYMGKF